MRILQKVFSSFKRRKLLFWCFCTSHINPNVDNYGNLEHITVSETTLNQLHRTDSDKFYTTISNIVNIE